MFRRAARVAAAFAVCLVPCAAQLTFNRDIAPIIYKNCSPCHRPEEAGPFPLLSYEDVRKHAQQIVTVTRSRYMPPWLPEPGYGDFKDARRLTEQQIRTIADWVTQGSPEGPPAAAPAPPRFTDGWQLGAPDLILEAPAAFTVPPSGPDVYWNFVFQPALSERRYVRAVEIRPGDRRLVHHANLLVDRAASAKPTGFPGMDLAIMGSPFDPEGHFLFWKPGSPPLSEPDAFSWRLDPGNQLVLNTHLQPSGKAEDVKPVIGLYFTDHPPTKFPLLLQLENDRALDIPAANANFVVSDDFQLPMDLDVLAIYPHAHYLGKRLEAYATLPDGARKWLIRIPNWNPAWQAVYEYRDPVSLPKGSVISMRFSYDNSAANPRNPNMPPKRVRAGDQAADEMAHLWLQALPRGPGDRRRELQEALLRHRLEQDPNNFEANFNLGAVMLSRLDARGAVTMLEAAVRNEPDRADARNMLGLALAATGRSTEAIDQFQTALKIQPENVPARFNLANALAKAGKSEEAIENYRQAIAALPEDPLPHVRLGAFLLRLGRIAEARQQFEQTLELDPGNESAKEGLEQVKK
jgi:tetratricopeptide (TPR) repeat protein